MLAHKERVRYTRFEPETILTAVAEGTLSGFPPPHVAQQLVEETTHPQVERAWRTAMRGRTLTAVLDV